MTVIDEEGNERPLEVGALVFCNPRQKLARVVEVDGIALCRNPSDNAEFWTGPSHLTLIGPPNQEEKKGESLYVRRSNLLTNLARTGSIAATELRHRIIFDNTWFWKSVAESVDNPRHISYAPERKYFDVDSRRKHCSFSKFLRGKAKENGLNLPEEGIVRLCGLVGETFPTNYDYSFECALTSDEVFEAYSLPENDNWGSCMSGKDYVRWYGENRDKVNVVMIRRAGEYVGRALLWTCDDGRKVLDRVYPSDNGPHTTAIHDLARANGWDYKTRQACCDGHLASGCEDYVVTMKPSSSGRYPYCDTFKYTNDNPYEAASIAVNVRGGRACFNDTGGYASGVRAPQDEDESFTLCCHHCNDEMNEDDAISVGSYGYTYCRSCADELFAYVDYRGPDGYVHGYRDLGDCTVCESCEETRLRRHTGSVIVISRGETQWWCLNCIGSMATQCSDCDDYVHNDEVMSCGDDYLCPQCYEDSCSECDVCEEAYRSSVMTEKDDERVLCPSCNEKEEAEGAKAEAEVEPAPPAPYITVVTYPAYAVTFWEGSRVQAI